MKTASLYHDLVSQRRRGPSATLLRSLMRAAEVPYSAAVRWRNHRFDSGLATIERLPVPVVSVGNLTLGGTGKTPLVEWLARWFRERDLRVALVSRGYGAEDGQPNDEARELRDKLPDVPHFQHADRVLAGHRAVSEAGAQVIVLDDAFQHRRVARDLNILLVDACQPFGYEHVFPRGTLREDLAGCRRADLIGLSRSDMVSPAERAAIWNRLLKLAPHAGCFELRHEPRALLSHRRVEQPTHLLRGRKVAALCGIGNPDGFRHVLARCGYDVAELWEFPDHHAFSAGDMHRLHAWADAQDVAVIVCTHKDLVKLAVDYLGDKPLWALTVGVEFSQGRGTLESRLLALSVQGRATRAKAA